MTILNVHLEPRRALVASNTQGIAPDGSRSNTSKLLALPHCSTVVAGRGQIGIWLSVYAECHASLADFDGLVARVRDFAQRQMAHFRQASQQMGAVVDLETEIVLIGWSPKLGEMACHRCHVSAAGEVTKHAVGGYLAPWDPAWGPEPTMESTSASLIEAARVQAMHAETAYPHGAWQGDLTMCEITPESITFTAVKDFCKVSLVDT